MAKNQNRNTQADPVKDPVELTEEQKQALALEEQAGAGSDANQQLDPTAGSEGGEGADPTLEHGTESPDLGALASPNILLVGGFQLAVRFSELLKEDELDIKVLDDKVVAAIEAGKVPLALHDLASRLPTQAITRYWHEIIRQNLDPRYVEFVIADPQTDPVLATINFMRSLQGLSETYFYPRFSGPLEGHEEPITE